MGTLQEQQRKFDESVAYIENLRTSEGKQFKNINYLCLVCLHFIFFSWSSHNNVVIFNLYQFPFKSRLNQKSYVIYISYLLLTLLLVVNVKILKLFHFKWKKLLTSLILCENLLFESDLLCFWIIHYIEQPQQTFSHKGGQCKDFLRLVLS